MTGRHAISKHGSMFRLDRFCRRTSRDNISMGRHTRSIGTRPEGDPTPLPYLLDDLDQREGALDLYLDVSLTRRMRDMGLRHINLPALTRATCIGRLLK
jgi:hypothetical protein